MFGDSRRRSFLDAWGGRIRSGIALVVFVLPGISISQPVIPGSFQVNPSGAATYSIPIQIPPPVAGFGPSLSLNYNSQGPAVGILGARWSLGGLSAVGRCPRTKGQDGVRGPILMVTGDAYCLDGMRLILTGGGSGADGSEYRTEMDNFSKITAYTESGVDGGPARFVVKTRDGLTLEYGGSGARMPAVGQTAIASWALNRAQDARGNYYTVSYMADMDNRVLWPSRVDYTGNSKTGLAPGMSVSMQYKTDANAVPRYSPAGYSRVAKILTNVLTTVGGRLVLNYALTTENSTATGRPLLKKVGVTGGDGAALASTDFMWQGSPLASTRFTQRLNTGICSWLSTADGVCNDANNYSYIRFADINGDGRPDMCIRADTGIRCLLATAAGWNRDAPIVTDICADGSTAYGGCNDDDNYAYIFFADVNGDGKADLIFRSDNGIRLWISTGTGFVRAQETAVCANSSTILNVCNDQDNFAYMYFPDINGDGRADFCYRGDSGIICFLSTGSAWDFSNPIATNICANNSTAYGVCNDANNYSTIRFQDMNGDGMADLVYRGDQGMRVWLSNGAGFNLKTAVDLCADGSSAYGICNDDDNFSYITHADINGDGVPDLCYRSDTGIRCVYGDGQGGWDLSRPVVTDVCSNSTSSAYGVCDNANNYQSIGFPDVNGDGMADLIYRGDAGMVVWLSNGTGFGNPQYYSICKDYSAADGGCSRQISNGRTLVWKDFFSSIVMMDVNGDGSADLVYRGSDGYQLWISQGDDPDLIARISNGLTAIDIGQLRLPAAIATGTYVPTGVNVSYPAMSPTPPMSVVATTSTSNGVGGSRSTSYQYGPFVAEVASGRGGRGFDWFQTQDLSTGLTTRSLFRQDFPYTGQIYYSATGTSAATWNNLSQQTFIYTCFNPSSGATANCVEAPGARYAVYPTIERRAARDLDGSALPGSETCRVLDGYANTISLTSDTLTDTGASAGLRTLTTNYFKNDLTNWLLGQMVRSKVVQSTGADAPASCSNDSGLVSQTTRSATSLDPGINRVTILPVYCGSGLCQ